MVAKPKRGRGRPRLIEDNLVNLIDMAARGEIHTLAAERHAREAGLKLKSRSVRAVCLEMAGDDVRKCNALLSRFNRAMRRMNESVERSAAKYRAWAKDHEIELAAIHAAFKRRKS